jgi:hypothetical protein
MLRKIYIQRLRNNLIELENLRRSAANSQDYNTEGQLREKISVLEIQLSKMEDCFNVDVIQNLVTRWQNQLLVELNEKLSRDEPVLKSLRR